MTLRDECVMEKLAGLQNEEGEIQTVGSSDNHGECIWTTMSSELIETQREHSERGLTVQQLHCFCYSK